jgi:ornithine carbamoyltransferase
VTNLRHFLRDDDLSPTELIEVLDLADQLKADRAAGRSASVSPSLADTRW